VLVEERGGVLRRGDLAPDHGGREPRGRAQVERAVGRQAVAVLGEDLVRGRPRAR
jgi:hypothetical protein